MGVVEEANQTMAAATFNYTVCYSESQNYSASCTTFFANPSAANDAPQFQWQQANFTNGSAYQNPLAIQFFANFTDDNGTASVVMTFNNVNYTMVLWNGTAAAGVWNYNVSQLSAGTYYYNFTASDGASANTSSTFSLVIAKASVNVSLFLNGTSNNVSYAAGDFVNASSSRNTSGEGNLTLYRNSTAVAFGVSVVEEANQTMAAATFNYTACYLESQNYSVSCTTFFANPSAANAAPQFQWQQANFTNGSAYQNPLAIQFFANFTDDNGTASVVMTFNSTNYTMVLWNGTSTNGVWNYNLSGLPAGSYAYNFTAFDGASATTSQDFTLTIAQNSTWALTHTLNGSASNLAGAYPSTVRAQCAVSGVSGTVANSNELRNGTTVQTSASIDYSETPVVGDWNFTCSNVGNANYSSKSSTFFFNVSKGSVGLVLTLNGTTNNVSYVTNTTVNASASRNTTGEGNLTLYRNSTAVAFGVAVAEEANQTPSTPQTLNYTVCYPESQNYSAACRTFFADFNTTASTAPQFLWQSFNSTNSSEFNLASTAFFSAFSDDNGTASVTLSFNGSNYTMVLWNGTATDGVWNYNLSGLGAGIYDFSYTAFDGSFATASNGFSLYVSKNSSATLTLHLNSSAQNLSITEGNSVNASGFKGWTEGTLDLLRNATLLNSSQNPSFSDEPALGYWNYALSYNETQNYSARSESLFVLVSSPSSGGGSSGSGGSSGNSEFFPISTPLPTPVQTIQPTTEPSAAVQPSSTPLPGTNLEESATPEVFYSIENAPGGLRILRSVRVLSYADGGKYSVVTITVFNGGAASLENVVVSGQLPQGGLNFAEAPPQVDGSQAKWILPELRSGESKTFTFSLDRSIAKSEFDGLAITAFATAASADFTPAIGIILLVLASSGLTAWFVRKNRQLSPEQQLEHLALEFEAERKPKDKL